MIRFLIFLGFHISLLIWHIRGAMIVTMYENKEELYKLFESTNDKVSKYPDPLNTMDIIQKNAFWQRILAARYFKEKHIQQGKIVEDFSNERPKENISGNRLSRSSSFLYRRREIHYGDQTQTRQTILCLAESQGIGFKEYYHIFYAYRRETYFIGELDSFNDIILTGLTEPEGTAVAYESQEKLEKFFVKQINSATSQGVRHVSPPSTPRKSHNSVCHLSTTEKIRLCGQVFESQFYREKGIEFDGKSEHVRECSCPQSVKFISTPFLEREHLEYMFGCSVTVAGAEQTYYISNSYERAVDENLSVFVFKYESEDDRQYLDAHVTALTVLLPAVPSEATKHRTIFQPLSHNIC